MFSKIIGHTYINNNMEFVTLCSFGYDKPTNNQYYWLVIKDINPQIEFRYFEDLFKQYPNSYISKEYLDWGLK